MENHSDSVSTTTVNDKVMTVSFMVAGLLAGFVVSVLIDTLASVTTGAFSRFMSGDVLQHAVPVVFGSAFFAALQFNAGVKSWADDVITELRRVVWPSRKDTISMTIVVCIMLIIAGLVFGFFDVVSGSIIDWLLHKNFLGIFG